MNAADLDGYVIFESHGFKDENIADRMHIVIRRRESPRWFSYWVARFDAMWETAKPGTAASDELLERLIAKAVVVIATARPRPV